MNTVEKYMVLNNFSNILSAMVFVIAIFSIAVVLSAFVLWITTIILAICLFVVLIFITLVTLGLIYMTTDVGKAWGWFDPMFNNATAITNFINRILFYMPFFDIAGIVAGFIAIFLLAKSQNEHKVAKIVWISISFVVLAFCTLWGFLYRGGAFA